MLKKFKNTITKIIQARYDASFSFKDNELEEAIEQTMNHLLANNLFFLKDITSEEFIESLWQYISMKRRIL